MRGVFVVEESSTCRSEREPGQRGRPNQPRRLAWKAALIFLVSSLAVRPSPGQDIRLPEDFRWPKLVIDGPVGHLAPSYAVAFSPDGKYLVSGGDDKMVRVWDFRDGEPRLDRTFRPPLNRMGGAIRALAISPVRDPKEGHYWLAVAGYSAIGNGGDILVYRLLGPNDVGSGDLALVLWQGDPRREEGTASGGPKAGNSSVEGPRSGEAHRPGGHLKMVYGLAFSPDGRYLASCGEDTTIRIWDLQSAGQIPQAPPHDARRAGAPETAGLSPVRVLRGHAGAVLRVAFLDGDRLVSTGGIGDGSVRLWAWKDVSRRLVSSHVIPPKNAAANNGQAVMINAMATSPPDGQYVVTGREAGELELLRTADLGARQSTLLNPDEVPEHRAIEALAWSPDGNWLAVSRLRFPAPPPHSVPRTECEISLRRMPAGDQARLIRVAGDVVRALAFSPDGRFLVTIGGEAQELTIHDLRAAPDDPAREVRGPGTVLWDVGFIPDAPGNPTVAYARNRPIGREPTVWEGFDFPGRRLVPVDQPDRLRRRVATFDGWTIRPVGLFRLQAERPGSNPVPLVLDQANGRWMSYTLIPPDPAAGHARLTVAIGTRSGMVAIHSLPDGRKTREFLGHSGPVNAMAPSPDGRWLASASADQALALWGLSGCDVRPPLGARLERDAQGAWIVKEVATRGFAEQMGLKVGDRVAKAWRWDARGMVELPLDRLDAAIDAFPPSQEIRLVLDLTRNGAAIAIRPQTSRRDQPALRLLAATNKEWIVWMPEGYYDTSIAGDRRLLGWHLNKVEPRNGRFAVLPSEFFPMSRYERLLHRADVIDRLLANADPAAAVRLAQSNPRIQPPPEIRVRDPQGALLGPVLQVQQPEVTLRIEAQGASAERGVASIRVRNNQVPNPQVSFPLPPPPVQALPETIRLWPGDNPISIEAVDDLGVIGRREVLVRYQPPQRTPSRTASRLLVRSVGIETFASAEIRPIEHADRDAQVVADFLKSRGESSNPSNRFDSDRIERTVLHTREAGADATSRGIRQVFDQLKVEALKGKLGAGDTVFLVLESYILDFGNGSMVLGADAILPGGSENTINADAIVDDLRYVTDTGCLMLLFLDGIHDDLPRQTQRNFARWARALQENGVMVLAASKQEKSERGQSLSRFAQAILESATVRGAGSVSPSPTLEEFQSLVIGRVYELTSRRQNADFYPPEHIQPGLIRIFEPQPRPSEDMASLQPGSPRH